jgi:hypothetical protein
MLGRAAPGPRYSPALGDLVAVYDRRARRWCRAEVLSVHPRATSCYVKAAEWFAVCPNSPTWIRRLAVVRVA